MKPSHNSECRLYDIFILFLQRFSCGEERLLTLYGSRGLVDSEVAL